MSETTKRPAIVTHFDMFAPPEWRWSATFGDFDLDCLVGTGTTEEDAISDLQWQDDEEDETP